MGFFSYKCAKSKISIPACPYALYPVVLSDVVLVLPDNTKIEGIYDGYGRISNVCIFDKLAPFVVQNRNATAKDIFEQPREITYKGKSYKFENWETPLTKEGYTANMLMEMGAKRESSYLNMANKLIKIVRKSEYKGESFKQLKVSQSCPAQGYFYSATMRNKLLKIAHKLK